MLKLRLGLILILLLSLTSCGFHLRGERSFAKPLQNIYVQSRAPYGELARNIRQDLRLSGVHLVSSPEQATTVLNITKESLGQDLLSINSSQQTRQYNLKLTVSFEITDPNGKALLPEQTVTETRPLTLQSNQILAGSNQAAQLFRDMRRSITYSIMNRLASHESSTTLLKAEEKEKHED